MAFTIPNEADAFHASQSDVDKVDLDIIAAGAQGTGVLNTGSGACAVTPNSLLVLNVAAGYVRDTTRVRQISATTVTIGAASADPRFDLVCARLDADACVVVAGAPHATNPVFPAIPADRVVLAAVYVPVGDATIDANQITDKRMFVGIAQTDYGGSAAGADKVIKSTTDSTRGHLSIQESLGLELPLLGAAAASGPAGNSATMFGQLVAAVAWPYFVSSLGASSGMFSMIGGPLGFVFGKGQGGAFYPGEAGGARQLDALLAGVTPTLTGTETFGVDTTYGAYARYTAASGGDAGLQLGAAGSGMYARNLLTFTLFKFRTPAALTNLRMYIGLSASTLGTLLGGSDPTASYVCAFFDSGVHASNLYTQRNDNSGGGTRSLIAAIAADTVYYLIFGWITANTAIVSLLDSNFGQMGAGLPTTLNMPATTTQLHPIFGIRDLGAVGPRLDMFYLHAVNYV